MQHNITFTDVDHFRANPPLYSLWLKFRDSGVSIWSHMCTKLTPLQHMDVDKSNLSVVSEDDCSPGKHNGSHMDVDQLFFILDSNPYANNVRKSFLYCRQCYIWSFSDLHDDALVPLAELCHDDTLYQLTTLSRALSQFIVSLYMKQVGWGKYLEGNASVQYKEIIITSVEMARALCVWRSHNTFFDVGSYYIKVKDDQTISSFFDILILFFTILSASPAILTSKRSLYVDRCSVF